MFHTTLLSLAIGTHLIVVSLSILVASKTGNGAADSALNARSNTGAQVIQLPLGFLLLTLEILLLTSRLQILTQVLLTKDNPSMGPEVNYEILTSLPTRLPTVSLAEPTVWFHEPAFRSGWSLLAPPSLETVAPGTLTAA